MNTNNELERLVEECDPIASHAKIMSYLQPSMPHIVHRALQQTTAVPHCC